MSRRLLPLLSLLLVASTLQAADKPNILFIFSDDQCYETIGAHGLTDIDTPNLDRLAKEGASFSHAYNMGAWAGAVCMSSRACLNTGRFLWDAKEATRECSQGKRKSWSQLMSDHGYETYMSGKWHVGGLSATKVFDQTGKVRAGMPKQKPAGYNRPKDESDYETGWKPWDKAQGGFWEGGTHWSEVLADESVAYLGEKADSDNPFFMYVAFNAPHDPRQAPKEYIDRYPLQRIKVPENFIPQYPDQGADGVPIIRDEKLAPFPRTVFAIKVNRQEYYASITHMDAQIGRILDALEKSGKADNTWIIFSSDHGLSVGHHGLVGKQNMYDPAMRAPFIVWGPGVKAGTTIDAPIYIQDAMATALEISGQTVPETVDYKSVLPLLDGRAEKSYDNIYGAYIDTQRMILSGEWKLIAYPQLKKVKLFHLKKDPMEISDLAGNSEYSEILAHLTALLENTMDEMNDPMTSLEEANYPKQLKKEKKDDH
ncbi:sulfatase-like hydrolase/transferase [Novipirellula artificiosorum]|uniref:Arylsulfatase n=1 Tax=Novipirellula artificiosorum TaxID=2528016 RepID=A0A5C6DAH1_9BACT|nr:sulfatase-like hydrolase/transferase [Novipirellula artificiosorum]TWU32236.1 Arylsulfatase [Novipirellula artificiosorum]